MERPERENEERFPTFPAPSGKEELLSVGQKELKFYLYQCFKDGEAMALMYPEGGKIEVTMIFSFSSHTDGMENGNLNGNCYKD